jgi:D-sedoheptulose 7-phosphate isomerase
MSTLKDYLRSAARSIDDLAASGIEGPMEEAVSSITAALAAGKPLLVCGNGGSAADSIHIAAELVGRFLKDRRPYNVIALPANAGIMTAWSNDFDFETVYSRQVEAHGTEGAVLLALSTSGNSPNILAAAAQARAMNMHVISMTGRTGGKLAALSDILLNVPSNSTPEIQQGHLCLYHYLCEAVEERLSS